MQIYGPNINFLKGWKRETRGNPDKKLSGLNTLNKGV